MSYEPLATSAPSGPRLTAGCTSLAGMVLAAASFAACDDVPSRPQAPAPAQASALRPAPNPEALAALLEAADRKADEPAPPPQVARIGTTTGLPDPPPARPTFAKIPPPTALGDVSLVALERAARAQLYFPLVDRCRDPSGAILPPDAVTLSFLLDPAGEIVTGSIRAHAALPAHAAAAACMRRELATLRFVGPAEVHASHPVTLTVPSVD